MTERKIKFNFKKLKIHFPNNKVVWKHVAMYFSMAERKKNLI
jgi:hypothetical protein